MYRISEFGIETISSYNECLNSLDKLDVCIMGLINDPDNILECLKKHEYCIRGNFHRR